MRARGFRLVEASWISGFKGVESSGIWVQGKQVDEAVVVAFFGGRIDQSKWVDMDQSSQKPKTPKTPKTHSSLASLFCTLLFLFPGFYLLSSISIPCSFSNCFHGCMIL